MSIQAFANTVLNRNPSQLRKYIDEGDKHAFTELVQQAVKMECHVWKTMGSPLEDSDVHNLIVCATLELLEAIERYKNESLQTVQST